MSDKIAAAEAALAVLKAEAAFKAKKAKGMLTNEDKLALRELRQVYRESLRRPVKDGAAPAAIGTKAEVS